MKIDIKRVDQTLPLPRYETSGAVAFDFVARIPILVAPRTIALIPSNIIVGTPAGFMLMIAPRSSFALKKGLMFPHSVGIVDQDFCGTDDEIKIQVYNMGDSPIQVDRGERIAQGVFLKMERADWQEVPEMQAKSRGGFGSTGGYAGHLASRSQI